MERTWFSEFLNDYLSVESQNRDYLRPMLSIRQKHPQWTVIWKISRILLYEINGIVMLLVTAVSIIFTIHSHTYNLCCRIYIKVRGIMNIHVDIRSVSPIYDSFLLTDFYTIKMASKLLGTYLVILDIELENNLNNKSRVLYRYFIAVREKELVLWNPGALLLSINLELFLFYKENAKRKKFPFFHCYNWIKEYTESIVYGSNEVTLERTGMGDYNYYANQF